MNIPQLEAAIAHAWDESVLPSLAEYIRIPAKSPAFDPAWERNGFIEAAVQLVAAWCRERAPSDAHVEIRRLPGRTPLLIVDIPGELPGCVLLYGHLDKQPEFSGWAEGLGPWEPVLRAGKLYGRGGADDGYAAFSALTAIAALRAQKVPLARCVLLIETSEESGSVDLPAHLEALGDFLGEPSLVVCLDADCGDYDRLWCTTSLRGLLNGRLHVRVLKEGVHSMASGIVPTPFRIVEQLIARIEDPSTGQVLPAALEVAIPQDRREQIASTAQVLGASVAGKLPWEDGVTAVSSDPEVLLANATWRAALAVTGSEGMPPLSSAGNVLLPELALKLSIRLPPTCDVATAASVLTKALESDPPYGARVRFEVESQQSGWNAPAFAPWLRQSIAKTSSAIHGREAVFAGCAGTIPFMAMLGTRYPRAQFFVTGVLGPQSNAHGPNEFLHVDYAKKLTACVAMVLQASAAHVE